MKSLGWHQISHMDMSYLYMNKIGNNGAMS